MRNAVSFMVSFSGPKGFLYDPFQTTLKCFDGGKSTPSCPGGQSNSDCPQRLQHPKNQHVVDRGRQTRCHAGNPPDHLGTATIGSIALYPSQSTSTAIGGDSMRLTSWTIRRVGAALAAASVGRRVSRWLVPETLTKCCFRHSWRDARRTRRRGRLRYVARLSPATGLNRALWSDPQCRVTLSLNLDRGTAGREDGKLYGRFLRNARRGQRHPDSESGRGLPGSGEERRLAMS